MQPSDFILSPHPMADRWPDSFRVVHLESGEESQFGSREECEEVIRLACADKLLGTFMICSPCDECGERIPDSCASMVNRCHAESCSLYPADCPECQRSNGPHHRGKCEH